MELLVEIIKFIVYTILIVGIAKYILVTLLRNFAESLNLNPKIVGNIAGVATSIPELLTISLTAITGLINAGIYNVISSNVINLILYMSTLFVNKNFKMVRNMAIRIDLIMVILTILIPIIMIKLNIGLSLAIVPLFILLCVFFYFINYRTHNYYLKDIEEEIDKRIRKEEEYKKNKVKLIIKYGIYIFIVGIILFVIGDLLSITLSKICLGFGVSEVIMGIILGFITSIPELMTFYESQKHHSKYNSLGVIEATNNLLTSNVLNLFIIQSIAIILFTIIH